MLFNINDDINDELCSIERKFTGTPKSEPSETEAHGSEDLELTVDELDEGR